MSRFALRLLLIPAGYVLAAIAATAVLIAVMLAHGTPADPVDRGIFTVMLIAFAPTLWWIVGPIVTVGFVVAAGLAEVFSLRSWVYFTLSGAAVAFMAWSLAEIGESGPVFSSVEACASGLFGGLVYWLVAGRSSGVSSPASAKA